MGCFFDDLMAASGGTLVSETFTTNGNFTPQAGVNLVDMVGVGAPGVAAIPPAYTPTTVQVANSDYFHGSSSGSTAGNPTWFGFNSAHAAAVAAINAGGSPTFTYYAVNTFYDTGTTNYKYNEFSTPGQSTGSTNILAGSATGRTVGTTGSSGSPVTGGSNYSSQAFVDYQYLTPGTGTSATVGASSTITSLSKTFPGGLGGAGSNTTFTNVAVVPLTVYPVVVPTGGSVTISYYQ